MKDNSIYLDAIKEFTKYTEHSWHMEGLQVLLSKPGRQKPCFDHPFRTDSYWVVLVLYDQLTILLNREEHVIKENNLVIIPPDAVRQSAGVESNCKIAWVAFTPGFLAYTGLPQKHTGFFDYLFNTLSTLQLTSEDADRFMRLITILQEKNFHNGSHPFASDLVRHFFNVFQFELASAYHKYSTRLTTVNDRKEDLLLRFLTLLSKHAKKERSLQFYADRLYVTPKHLTQTIKKITGKTAGKHIDDQVIMEARNMLRNPLLTIAQVADLLYFNDQYFFSKYFKRYTGTTPSDFRKTTLSK